MRKVDGFMGLEKLKTLIIVARGPCKWIRALGKVQVCAIIIIKWDTRCTIRFI